MYHKTLFTNPVRHDGPLQISHDFQFIPLNLTENFDWPDGSSEEYKLEHIKWRLKRLADRGFGGVVINVAFRKYMEDDTAWDRFVKTVDMAVDLGLRIWIYDEQYYPSGMAGGLALRGHPELEAKVLGCLIKDVDSPDAPVRIASPHGHASLKFAFAVPLIEMQNEPAHAAVMCPDFQCQEEISHLTDSGGGLCWDCPGGKWRIYCFFTRSNYEGTYLCRTIRSPHRSIDCLSTTAVKRFLDITYGNYGKWLGERLGKDIEAIFADEPGLLAYTPYPENYTYTRKKAPSESIVEQPDLSIPILPFMHWSDDIEEAFLQHCGYLLKDNLPELFDGDSERACGLRLDYRRCTAIMFDEAYNGQYIRLTEANGLSYSGHFRSIRHMLWHPDTSGDLLHNLGQMHIPGCDRLDSDPVAFRYRIDCKLASSAAHLYRKKQAMIEASHMYNTSEPLKLDLMMCSTAVDFAQGINIITSYFGENVLRDDEYKAYCRFVSRMTALFSDGLHQAQALLYYPYEQIAYHLPVMGFDSPAADKYFTLKGNRQNAIAARAADSFTSMAGQLIKLQIDYDFINDEKLAQCHLAAGSAKASAADRSSNVIHSESSIVTPNGEMPSMIIFPDIDCVCTQTANFIDMALDAGIFVGFMGQKRAIYIRQEVKSKTSDIPKIQSERIVFMGEEANIRSADFRTETPCPGLVCMHKQFAPENCQANPALDTNMQSGGSPHDLYLLVNSDRQELVFNASIPCPAESSSQSAANTEELMLLDPVSGESDRLECRVTAGRIFFCMRMTANSTKIIISKH